MKGYLQRYYTSLRICNKELTVITSILLAAEHEVLPGTNIDKHQTHSVLMLVMILRSGKRDPVPFMSLILLERFQQG